MGKLEKILLVTLILVTFFSRAWKISAYMTFLGDEGRDATVVRDMLLGRKYTLIGPGTSVGNMYLGPWYYYLMIPSLWITHLSPVGPALMIACLGTMTVALLWWISRIWIGKYESWLISFLYTFSPVIIFYSRSSWNPNIMPFFALLSIYSTWAIFRYQKYKYFIILAFSLAMVLNSHYLGLLLFPTIAIYLFFSKNHSGYIKYLISSILLLLLLLSPLLIFDARHGWQNLSAMKQFFAVRQTTVNLQPQKSLPNIWPIWVNINSSLLSLKNIFLAQTVSLISVLSLVFFSLKYLKNRFQYLLLFFWLGFGILGLGLYKQHIYDHYFGFIFPAIFLSLGLAFKSFGKYVSLFIFLVLLVLNLSRYPLLSEPNNQLWRTRQVADYIQQSSQGKPFNLALLSNHNYDASYRYFINKNYYTLHERIADQLFVICENPKCDVINNPLWEIAGFGWSKIDASWDFPWGVKLYKLSHNPSGNS